LTEVERLLFVRVDVAARVFDIPRVNYFDAREALGRLFKNTLERSRKILDDALCVN
jgi:hypothetical protein